MRPPIGTKCWFLIVSSIALVWTVLSSPMRTAQSSEVPSRKQALVADGTGQALSPASPAGTSIDAGPSELIEENEDESFWPFSHLVSPAFLTSVWPPGVLSAPFSGNTPARIGPVPLRC